MVRSATSQRTVTVLVAAILAVADALSLHRGSAVAAATAGTPPPAWLNGVYCRGIACMYRKSPPPPTTTVNPAFTTPMTLVVGGHPVVVAGVSSGSGAVAAGGGNVAWSTNPRWFCRGLSCGSGRPPGGATGIDSSGGTAAAGGASDPHSIFRSTASCIHLLHDLGGGLQGLEQSRTVVDVRNSFLAVCQRRVGNREAGACGDYADVIAAAVSSAVDSPTVGDVKSVCELAAKYVQRFKQAEIDIRLSPVTLPQGDSLLSVSLGHLGTGGIGSSSPRGRRWWAWAWQHLRYLWPAAGAATTGGSQRSLSQLGMLSWTEPINDAEEMAKIPGANAEVDTPRGRPRYQQDFPIRSPVQAPRQGVMKYQILPGSDDGRVGPVEVNGAVFGHCVDQMSEVMLGFPQTAYMTVKMLRDWCSWQASVTTWVGQKDEYGHPDWDQGTCKGMEQLVSFAFRNNLDTTIAFSPQQACKKMFLGSRAVHKYDEIVLDAWSQWSRSPAAVSEDIEMKDLLHASQQHSDEVFANLRGQAAAYEKLQSAQSATAQAVDEGSHVAPVQALTPAPLALPDVDDLDPMAGPSSAGQL